MPEVYETTFTKRDIYYIVLSAYGRSDILWDYYEYDNSKFISYLEDKGFIVPSNIQSNYPATTLSIPSTLKMDYVDNMTSGLAESQFWWLMKPYVTQSSIQLFLEKENY